VDLRNVAVVGVFGVFNWCGSCGGTVIKVLHTKSHTLTKNQQQLVAQITQQLPRHRCAHMPAVAYQEWHSMHVRAQGYMWLMY
jgi:hypothetical protein